MESMADGRGVAPMHFQRLDRAPAYPLSGGQLIDGDLTDLSSLDSMRSRGSQPDEVYNLGAQIFSGHVLAATGVDGRSRRHRRMTLWMLKCDSVAQPGANFYQASSSEMFGLSSETDRQRRKDAVLPAQPLRLRQS